ncbi:Dyp-type peroxidase family protein, partial [mine drainage metagenome]
MPPETPQPVTARLTSAAIFLVVTLGCGSEQAAAVRALCVDLAALVRGVGFRAPDGQLSCVVGFAPMCGIASSGRRGR